MIPTQRARGREAAGPFRAWLELADAKGLAERLDSALVLRVEPAGIELDLSRYAGGRPTQRDDYRTTTFLVDHDEERLAAWVQQIVDRHGSTPTLAQLVGAVQEVISADMSSGYLPASVILRRRSGDCTEHAVLFAALSRALAIPTRIVSGVALVALDDGEVQAFGHAWNEVLRGGAWELLDSTPMVGGRAVAYVPVDVVEDEGPGYAFALMDSIQRRPRAVRLIGRAPEAGRGTDPPERAPDS